MTIRTAFAILLIVLSTAVSEAVELRQDTLEAWDDYIGNVNLDMAQRAAGSRTFLWVDDSPEILRRVKHDEVVVTDHDPRKVPHGLIHHWFGAMFVPNVTLDQVMGVLSSYDRYCEMYKPLITRVAVLKQGEDNAELTVVAMQKAFSVTAAVETDDEVKIVRPAPNRVLITTTAVRVQEIADYGQPIEHVFVEDRRPGYVWRAVVVQRLEQRDGGVYVEFETISLSRGIPLEVRWLIKPLTNDLPRKLMLDMLNDTRAAALQECKVDRVSHLDSAGAYESHGN
ncbi:MAG: hypothetical protein WBE72_16565 [Terracidiphilus sp.]